MRTGYGSQEVLKTVITTQPMVKLGLKAIYHRAMLPQYRKQMDYGCAVVKEHTILPMVKLGYKAILHQIV
nr:MAG TPA: hypothetical protein [Caudoviricetes sp.]